jgi:hypothetical protein
MKKTKTEPSNLMKNKGFSLDLKIGDFLKTKKKAAEEIFTPPLPLSLTRPKC